MNQVKGGCERSDDSANFRFDLRTLQIEFVDVIEALSELDSQLMRNSAAHSGQNFRK